jgi:hypothetical protein
MGTYTRKYNRMPAAVFTSNLVKFHFDALFYNGKRPAPTTLMIYLVFWNI